MAENTPVTTSLGIVFARFFWIQLGPLILMVLAYNIVMHGGGWLTVMDFLFFGLLAGLILARWAEFRGGHALTSTGDPATIAHLRRYTIGATVIGLSVWAIANVVGNHVITRS